MHIARATGGPETRGQCFCSLQTLFSLNSDGFLKKLPQTMIYNDMCF